MWKTDWSPIRNCIVNYGGQSINSPFSIFLETSFFVPPNFICTRIRLLQFEPMISLFRKYVNLPSSLKSWARSVAVLTKRWNSSLHCEHRTLRKKPPDETPAPPPPNIFFRNCFSMIWKFQTSYCHPFCSMVFMFVFTEIVSIGNELMMTTPFSTSKYLDDPVSGSNTHTPPLSFSL